MYNEKIKAEALRLRVIERLSLDRIADAVNVSKATVSHWLRAHPLTNEEKRARMVTSGQNSGLRKPSRQARLATQPSKFYKMSVAQKLTTTEIGRVAEAAVLFRLSVFGLVPLSSAFEQDSVDLVVKTGNGYAGIQVKTAHRGKHGAPYVALRCSSGRNKFRKYTRSDGIDFFVGYDLYSDTACVWTWAEIDGKGSQSFTPEAAEAWHKIS